jgi:hypothetical protein
MFCSDVINHCDLTRPFHMATRLRLADCLDGAAAARDREEQHIHLRAGTLLCCCCHCSSRGIDGACTSAHTATAQAQPNRISRHSGATTASHVCSSTQGPKIQDCQTHEVAPQNPQGQVPCSLLFLLACPSFCNRRRPHP